MNLSFNREDTIVRVLCQSIVKLEKFFLLRDTTIMFVPVVAFVTWQA